VPVKGKKVRDVETSVNRSDHRQTQVLAEGKMKIVGMEMEDVEIVLP
jgi:hypothetical protein